MATQHVNGVSHSHSDQVHVHVDSANPYDYPNEDDDTPPATASAQRGVGRISEYEGNSVLYMKGKLVCGPPGRSLPTPPPSSPPLVSSTACYLTCNEGRVLSIPPSLIPLCLCSSLSLSLSASAWLHAYLSLSLSLSLSLPLCLHRPNPNVLQPNHHHNKRGRAKAATPHAADSARGTAIGWWCSRSSSSCAPCSSTSQSLQSSS
eukprot:1419734-Rhodomonas_salina.1